LAKGELVLGRLRWRALVREAEAKELRVLIGSEDGCLEKKGKRGIVMVVVSGLGAIDAEDEAKRQKTERREISDEAAIDGWIFLCFTLWLPRV
jgi:hypothetical protein